VAGGCSWAQRRASADNKARTNTLVDGTHTRAFKYLLEHISTVTVNTCRHPATGVTFPMTTSPNPTQQKALDLLNSIDV